MSIQRIKVELRAQYSMLPAGPDHGGKSIGQCDFYECHVIIDGDETKEKTQHLLTVAQDACMAMKTVANATPTSMQIILNGQKQDSA